MRLLSSASVDNGYTIQDSFKPFGNDFMLDFLGKFGRLDSIVFLELAYFLASLKRGRRTDPICVSLIFSISFLPRVHRAALGSSFFPFRCRFYRRYCV